MQQLSPEWFAARLGRVTASRISDVLATIKTGESADRRNYRAQLVAERLTGASADSYTNSAMQWGIDTEPQARAAYEFYRDTEVAEAGFVPHPLIEFAGASPDGLISDDGLLEIKCPNTATHIDYLLAGVPPAKYQNQMLWQMECASREWCDFVSFDPRMPAEMQLFVVRFNFDEDRVRAMRGEVIKFLDEVNETISKLKGLRDVSK